MEAGDWSLIFGLKYSQQQKWEEAIKYFNKSLLSYQENGKHENIIACLLSIANCYQVLGKYNEAVKNFEHCLPIIARYNIDKKLKRYVYLGLGKSLININKYQESQKYLQKALNFAKEFKDRELECKCYQALADRCGILCKFPKALEYAKQAFKVAQEYNLIKEQHKINNVLGNAYLRLGRKMEAINAFEKYRQHTIQVGDKVNEGWVLDSLSKCYVEVHDYEKATHLAQDCISIAKTLGSLELECSGYRNIGISLREKGETLEALKYHKKQLSLAIKTEDKEQKAIALNSLGLVCLKLSKLSEAFEYFEKCRILYIELGLKNSIGVVHNNLGSIYLQTGKYNDASKHFEQSLSISQITGDRTTQETAYQNLSIVCGRSNKQQLSEEFELKSIIIAIQTRKQRGDIVYLHKLGNCFSRNKDFKQAIKFFKKALCLSLKMNNSQLIGISYRNIGETYLALGMPSIAMEVYEDELRTFTQSGLRNDIARCLTDIACNCYLLSHSTNGNLSEHQTHYFYKAEQYLRESIQLLEEIFYDLREKYELKVSIVDTYTRSFKTLALILLEQDRIKEGLSICDRGRSCALADILNVKYGMQQQYSRPNSLNDIDLTSLLTEKSCIVFYSIIHDNLYVVVVSMRLTLKCTSNQFSQNAITHISQMVDSTYQVIGVRQMTTNESEDRSLANQTYHSEKKEYDEHFYTNIVTAERSPSSSDASDTVQRKYSNKPLEELYKKLIRPVKDHLSDDKIVIVPEGPLYRVPFAALQDPQTGRYLCESHCTQIVPSLATLKILKDSSPNYHYSEGALVVGNPFVGEVMFRGERKTFTSLPAAETEATVISSVLNVSPLIGNDATKDTVKAQLKEAVAIIHIAAHGDSNTGEIALAPVISKGSKPVADEEDYILTMKEVEEIGVRAKLVVLSCCHSGRGEICAEGVVGMARAFLAAGARAVVASLWAINDEATLDFMCGFYTHLKYGESASESLNESMKELKREEKYKHSKYWAPFVLIGDDVTIF